MNLTSIFLPVLIQVLLTLIMFLILGARKSKAIKAGGVDRQKAALNNSAWPEDVVKVSNNIANQFQMPNLFYVLCIFFYTTNTVNTAVLVIAWLYVLTRIIHAYIHISSNYVPARYRAFLISAICLIVMTFIAFSKLLIS